MTTDPAAFVTSVEAKSVEGLIKDATKRSNVDFEEALEETGFGKFNINLILVCGVLLFAVNTDAYGIGFTVPAAECELELNSYKKGILTSTSISGMTIGCTIWGYLSDIKGRRNLLLLNLVTAFLTGLAAAVTPSFWGFCILRFFNGICISGPTAMIFIYVGEFLRASIKATSMALVTSFLGLAMIYLPSMGWFLLQQVFNAEFFGLSLNNWRTYMLVNSVPNAIAALGLMTLPESPKFLYHSGNPREALAILKKMYSCNTGNSEDSFPVESLSSKVILEKSSSSERSIGRYFSEQILPLFKPPLLVYTFTACFIQAVNFAVSTGLLSWYPDIITQISNSGKSDVTVCEALSFNRTTEEVAGRCNNVVNDKVFILNIIVGVYYFVGYAVWGVVIRTIGTRNFFMSCMGIAAVGMIAFCFLTKKTILDIFFITALVLPGISVATTNAWVIEIFPTHICGMALCTILTAGRLGGVASSAIVGIMLDWNCLPTFLMYALSLIVSLVLSLLLPQKKLD